MSDSSRRPLELTALLEEIQRRTAALTARRSDATSRELESLASRLEEAARGCEDPAVEAGVEVLERELLAEEAELSALSERIDTLIQLCRRAAP